MMEGLHNVDALFGLGLLPDGSVDMVFTDPPYPTISGGNRTEHRGADGRKQRCTGILSANDGKIFRHNDTPIESYAGELFRVLKDPGHCYVMTNELNRRRTEDALIAAGFRIHKLLVWRKNNVTPNRWYMSNVEFTLFARKGAAMPIRNPGSKVVHDFDNPVGRKSHPTEKPVDLVRFYIENSCPPGGLVLDPFVGSGATAVAAVESGRRFLAFEIDPEHFATAKARIETAMSEMTDDTTEDIFS